MRKQAEDDLHKARKAMTDLTNVVEDGGVGGTAKAKAIRRKRPAKKKIDTNSDTVMKSIAARLNTI